jgi:hypothetical protein
VYSQRGSGVQHNAAVVSHAGFRISGGGTMNRPMFKIPIHDVVQRASNHDSRVRGQHIRIEYLDKKRKASCICPFFFAFKKSAKPEKCQSDMLQIKNCDSNVIAQAKTNDPYTRSV